MKARNNFHLQDPTTNIFVIGTTQEVLRVSKTTCLNINMAQVVTRSPLMPATVGWLPCVSMRDAHQVGQMSRLWVHRPNLPQKDHINTNNGAKEIDLYKLYNLFRYCCEIKFKFECQQITILVSLHMSAAHWNS